MYCAPLIYLLSSRTRTTILATISSSPFSMSNTSHPAPPSLKTCKHVSLDPCQGKTLQVRIVDAAPLSSDILVGRSLIQYNPNVNLGHQYRHRGIIRARLQHKRFTKLMLSYSRQVLEFVDEMHQPYCSSSLSCVVCQRTADVARLDLDWSGKQRDRLHFMETLAEQLEWLLSELILILKEQERLHPLLDWSKDLPCQTSWRLDPVAWTMSTRGLVEIGQILSGPRFERYWQIWEPVMTAHLTFTCIDLTDKEELVEQWLEEGEEKSAEEGY